MFADWQVHSACESVLALGDAYDLTPEILKLCNQGACLRQVAAESVMLIDQDTPDLSRRVMDVSSVNSRSLAAA
jgi:hypothetical protein